VSILGTDHVVGSDQTKKGLESINAQLEIDKLTVVIGLKNPQFREAAFHSVKALPSWHPDWKWAGTSRFYRYSIQRSIHKALIQADPYSTTRPAFRVEFNPGKIGAEGARLSSQISSRSCTSCRCC
jgi:hypothetical protein